MSKRANESLNEIGELHRVCALIGIIAFEYKAHKHGILTPPTSLKHKTICKKAYMEMRHNTCNTQIVGRQEKIGHKNWLNKIGLTQNVWEAWQSIL